MKPKTQIELIREKHQQIQTGICELLEISEHKYMDFMYDEGYNYLRKDLKLDEWSVDQLTSNRIYWNWWRQQWFNLDKLFIKRFPKVERSLNRASTLKSYYLNDYHSSINIKHCHLDVLQKTYNEMIGKILKQVQSTNNKINDKDRPGKGIRVKDSSKRNATNSDKATRR